MRGGDLWTLPGKSPAEIAATRLPAHSTLLVWLDLVFALVVAAVLMVLAGWLYRSNWSTGWHLRREIALLVVTVVAALGYLVSEAIENGTMFKVVGDRTASDGQALALARAENGKWACLLVAVLGIVALFPRRPSARRSANSAP